MTGRGRPPADRRDAATIAIEAAELRRLRRRIDALDRRIVALLNERTELGRDVGRVKARAGRRAIRDVEREREVLLRVTMANAGPLPQADLIALYRRLMTATRRLEAADRRRELPGGPPEPAGGARENTADGREDTDRRTSTDDPT